MTNTLFELCSEEARKEIAKSDMWQIAYPSISILDSKALIESNIKDSFKIAS